MENNDRKNNNSDTSKSLPSISDIPNQQTKKPKKSRRTPKTPDDEKRKSYRRSWRSTGPVRRTEIILLAVGAAGALGYLGVTVWGTLQTKWNFQAEHKPVVIHSRPPKLMQTFTCDAANHIAHMGNMQVFFKNVGTAQAGNVSWEQMVDKVIPQNKTGDNYIDLPPEITPATCTGTMDDGKETKMAPGVELALQMRQGFTSIPEQIGPGAVVNFYLAHCIYYTDDYGGHHATCDRYRLLIPGSNNPGSNNLDSIIGAPAIACGGKEVVGDFVLDVFGHCQN